MALDVGGIVSSASRSLAPIGATLSDTWSAIIGDRVAAWRLKNAAALQRAVDAEIGAMGLTLDRTKVPERYALTWFEEATKQDEPELLELFARLLVRAAAGDDDASDRRHLEILTHFTPEDAVAFKWFFGTSSQGQYPSFTEHEAWTKIKPDLGDRSWMAIEHLIALGVLERRFDTIKREEGFFGEDWTATAEITATQRGMSLYRACNPGKPNTA
jgi:hypothetical protein